MIFFILPLFLLADLTQTPTPFPTSKSGVPSAVEAFLACGFSLLAIFLIVLVLCVKKSSDNEAFGSLQALLVRPDV